MLEPVREGGSVMLVMDGVSGVSLHQLGPCFEHLEQDCIYVIESCDVTVLPGWKSDLRDKTS